MKSFFYTIILAGILAIGANAAISKSDDGCYHISNAQELKDFAAVVNGGEYSACGKLDNDIDFQGSQNNQWIPLIKFSGLFDGQNNTISGLYYNGTASYVGFIGRAVGGAVINNLKIAETTFISSGNYVGGFIGDISDSKSDDIVDPDDGSGNKKMVVINNCGFKGTTLKASWGVGGLVGSINENAKIAITNSFNEGSVSASKKGSKDAGGLIGYINPSQFVSIANCYNLGKITYVNDNNRTTDANPIAGTTNGKTLSMEDVYCSGGNCSGTGVTKFSDKDVKVDATCKDPSIIEIWKPKCETTTITAETQIIDAFQKKLADPAFQAEHVWGNIDGKAIEAMMGEELKGLNFETEYDTEKGTSKLIAKTNATIADGKELTDAFSIPQNVNVDSIYISRSFTAGRWSTIMLPFDFIDNYLTGENGNTKEITGAEFYTLTGMKVVDGKWQIQAQRIKTLEANKPYLILPKVTGTLTFSGKVALKQTTAGTQTVKDENGTDWTFTGVYAAEQWNVERPPFDETNPKGYQIYGFAGQDQDEKGITAGNFVKVGYNVQIQPLRAYLYYPGLNENPDVANPTPNPNGMPALNKAPRALAKTAAESFELPDNIEVIINEDPIIIESLIIPPAPVVEEDTTGNKSGNTDEGNDEDQEGTTGIAKPVTAPVMNKQATWYDLKGRRMGNKPQTQGTYIKNRTPVIVK